jgi:hypothetical protein
MEMPMTLEEAVFEINGPMGMYNIVLNFPSQQIEDAMQQLPDRRREPTVRMYVLVKRILDEQKEALDDGTPFVRLFDGYIRKRRTMPEMPKLVDRTRNVAKAIFRFVVEGMPVQSRSEAAQRVAICETNECGFFDGSICRHKNCGCYTKVKTFLTTEHCPLQMW